MGFGGFWWGLCVVWWGLCGVWWGLVGFGGVWWAKIVQKNVPKASPTPLKHFMEAPKHYQNLKASSTPKSGAVVVEV